MSGRLELQILGHGARYRQIAGVLARHGLGFLVAGLRGHREPLDIAMPALPLRSTPAAHVRQALQELGTTFVKFGQILSTRADLLPPAYREEFARLQDDDIPVPREAVASAIADALGRPPEECFARFDWTPLAVASIGQVHAAVLEDGREVVVKVRRPGVVAQVHEDLEILRHLAARACRLSSVVARYDVAAMVEEFAQVLLGELDYLREARSIERFAENFAGDVTLHVPWVDWSRTAPAVLTMERLHGVKPLDLAAIDALGLDRRELASDAARIVLRAVFEHGFYHADPHPGNFFVEPGGRIALVDYGMMGIVDDRTREQLSALLIAVASQDADQLVDALLELGLARQAVDRRRLAQDLDRNLTRYYERPLTELPIGPLIEDAFGVVREHGLALPPQLVLLLKTAVMAEGVGAQLDPEFHLPVLIAPMARRLVRRQYAPTRVARQLRRALLEGGALTGELPRRLRRLLSDAERGAFQVGVRLDDPARILRPLERLTNRLLLGMLAAAFIVGLAVLLSAYHPPGWERWAGRMFAVGFVLVSLIAVNLAWVVLRGSRR